MKQKKTTDSDLDVVEKEDEVLPTPLLMFENRTGLKPESPNLTEEITGSSLVTGLTGDCWADTHSRYSRQVQGTGGKYTPAVCLIENFRQVVRTKNCKA